MCYFGIFFLNLWILVVEKVNLGGKELEFVKVGKWGIFGR